MDNKNATPPTVNGMETTGTNTSQAASTIETKLVKQVHILSPDLSTKDAGKWMTSWRTAANVFYDNRQALYDFYTYILGMDGYLRGVITKRHTAVLNKKLIYKKGEEKVDAMDALIRSKAFKDLLADWLWAQRWGVGAQEFVPGKEFKWVRVPYKHIKTKWRLISIEQMGNTGYSFDHPMLFVIDNGDLGDLQSASLAAAYKKDAIGDWADLIEGWGQPTMVMYYDAFNPQVLVQLDSIMQAAGSARRIKLPKGTEFQQHEIKGTSGKADLQARFIELCNKEMATCILGGSETTGSSKGSGYAQSETHLEQQKEIMKADMDYLCDLLNSPKFTAILRSYGLPVADGGYFEHDREVDIEFIKDYKDVLQTAQQMGVPMSKKFVYETLAIPLPKEGEELLLPPAQPHTEPDGDEPTDGDELPEDKKPAKNKDKKQGKKPGKIKPAIMKTELSDVRSWGDLKAWFKSFFD